MKVHRKIEVGTFGNMKQTLNLWKTQGRIITEDWVQRWFIVEIEEK